MDPIKFDFTKEDFIAFNLYHAKHSAMHAVQRRLLMAVALIGGAVLGIQAFIDPSAYHLWPVAVVLGIVGVFTPVVWNYLVGKTVDWMLREGGNSAMLGPKEIVVTPIEMTAAGALISMTIRWAAVDKVVGDEDYLHIYYSSVGAIPVPRRAFPDRASFEAWAGLVRKYWEAGKSLNNS